MKKHFFVLSVTLLLLNFGVESNAMLFDRGFDSQGCHLIYDSTLDVTWYDYTLTSQYWSTANSWADNLSVTFNSEVFADWELPNIEDFVSLVNDFTSDFTSDGVLDFTDPLAPMFSNIDWSEYWTATEPSGLDPIWDGVLIQMAWFINPWEGLNTSVIERKEGFKGNTLVFRQGDVHEPVPEPTTMLLLGTGIAGLAGIRVWSKKKCDCGGDDELIDIWK